MSTSTKTALVTGANSGIEFEAAAQLAENDYRVILACRTQEKAKAAKAQLIQRIGQDVFDELAVDTAEVSSAQAASDVLKGVERRLIYSCSMRAGVRGHNPPTTARVSN